jgi:hypothetical protein
LFNETLATRHSPSERVTAPRCAPSERIVSVLDDRLSDMQTDLQSVNRELRKLRDDDQFQFGNEDD